MTASNRQRPADYRIRVATRLDARWAPWFDDFTLTGEGDGTTTITGSVTDQTHLHGLLARIRDLGIVLISVQSIRPPGIPDPAAATRPPASLTFRRRKAHGRQIRTSRRQVSD